MKNIFKCTVLFIISLFMIFQVIGTHAYAAEVDFTKGFELKSQFDKLLVRLIDDEGNIYLEGYDYNYNKMRAENYHIIKMNSKGEVLASISGRGDEFKQVGDKIYIMLERGNEDWSKKLSGLRCKVYSKDLKLEKTYDTSVAKSWQYADVNSNKMCYLKGEKKVYICDLDGKNKKLLYDFSKGKLKDTFCQGIAMTEDYVGIVTEYWTDTERVTYSVVINIETGKATIKKNSKLWLPTAFGEKIVWNSNASGTGSMYAGSKQIVYFDGKKIKTIKTDTAKEVLKKIIADNDGNFITGNNDIGIGDEKGAHFRIYSGNKMSKVKQIDVAHNGFVCFAANCGTIAYSYQEEINGKNYVRTVLFSY